MKKIEAPTLEHAYEKAALELGCSITQLRCEVIQHPNKGFMGLFKKPAIIVADCNVQNRDDEHDNDIHTLVAEEIVEEVLQSKESTAETPASTANPSVQTSTPKKHPVEEVHHQSVDDVLESFFEKRDEEETFQKRPANNNIELADKIEAELAELLSHSCFDIDTVEVDVVDNTALIFVDGEDAALLIGKEGYRYNALSYMLFNWLHTKYNLFIKLEIAQFLTSQQEMIYHYIKPVIEHVKKNGKGKTRPLDGILVQIALEQLREAFPHKYVAVKTGRDGKKFVIINDFNNRSHG